MPRSCSGRITSTALLPMVAKVRLRNRSREVDVNHRRGRACGHRIDPAPSRGEEEVMAKDASKWTAKQIRREAHRLLGANSSTDEQRCAEMMITALIVGADADKIAERLGVDRDSFSWMFDNLQRNGVFRKNGRIHANWAGKDGGLEFCLDVAVGTGLLERAKSRPGRKSAKIGSIQ